MINTENPGQEQVQFTVYHSDQNLMARQKVTISVELEFYPFVTAKSELHVVITYDCYSDLVGVAKDKDVEFSEKPYYLYEWLPIVRDD